MVKKASILTYDYACFLVLAYEYGDNKVKDSEKKIKSKLKCHQLGAFDEKHINMLREFKETLSAEIHLYNGSNYYTFQHSAHSNIEDYDYKRMAGDYALKFPLIHIKEIGDMITMAINLYYLR